MAAALLIVLAPAAWASSWQGSYNPAGPGYITAEGNVTWDSKIQFDHEAWLGDVCGSGGQGDGFGVATEPIINTPSSVNFNPLWTNTTGCGTLVYRNQLDRRVGGQNVQNITYRIYLTDEGDLFQVAITQCMDNHNVGGNQC